MYSNYFGFNEKPFTLTPNPRFIYLSKNHKEAFAHLLYGINNHYGFIALTGEVGAGKTTVLRTLLGQLQDNNHRIALILNPGQSCIELLRNINSEYAIDASSSSTNELLAVLNRFLLEENANARTVVLVIDEAQNLDPATLEQIRLISNLETENDKLIQIILAGQPELEQLLARPELRQLNQRIAVRYRLGSISSEETRGYIRHRMEVAGESGGVSFSDSAIRSIYRHTRGTPRMLNILCDRALLIAYGDERRTITPAIIKRAIREINSQPQKQRVIRYAIASAIAVMALFLVVAAVSRHSGQTQGNSAGSTPGKKRSPSSAALTGVERELSSCNQASVHLNALNALLGSWHAAPYASAGIRLTTPHTFSRLAAKRGLRLTLFQGTVDEAIRFNLPFLAVTTVSGDLGPYCLAVTAVHGDTASVSPALSGKSLLDRKELVSLTTGNYYLVWKNSGHIPDTITPGDRLKEVKILQQLLTRAGMYHEPADGIYGNATVVAVREFQRSRGIASDDMVGELTLAALAPYYTM